MANTIPMKHLDTGKTADVHPDEVENMSKAGFREVVAAAPPPPPPPPAASKPTLSLKQPIAKD